MAQRVGQRSEARILRIINSLEEKGDKATQSELVRKTKLDTQVVRQILRRLRRQKKVSVSLESSGGKKQVRVYSIRREENGQEESRGQEIS